MTDCCSDKECAIATMKARQSATLKIVLTQSGWPDLIVGLALACLFLRSAIGVSASALRELRINGPEIA